MQANAHKHEHNGKTEWFTNKAYACRLGHKGHANEHMGSTYVN